MKSPALFRKVCAEIKRQFPGMSEEQLARLALERYDIELSRMTPMELKMLEAEEIFDGGFDQAPQKKAGFWGQIFPDF